MLDKEGDGGAGDGGGREVRPRPPPSLLKYPRTRVLSAVGLSVPRLTAVLRVECGRELKAAEELGGGLSALPLSAPAARFSGLPFHPCRLANRPPNVPPDLPSFTHAPLVEAGFPPAGVVVRERPPFLERQN